MKYKYSRNYIAKLIDERTTGFCGMKTVDERCKQVLNAVCGDLIPLLYATKPTKVKKIAKLLIVTRGTELLNYKKLDLARVINELVDAVNSLLTNEKTI